MIAANEAVARFLADHDLPALYRIHERPSPPRVAHLAALPPALARLALQRLADEAGGPALGAHADAILALGGSGGTAALDLPGGLRAVVAYGRLTIERRRAEPAPAPVTLTVPGAIAYGAGTVTCERGADLPIEDGTLDAQRLAPTLEVRPWRPGDRLRPLGLDGSKTLQDLFTDRKVPRERRAHIPVVVSAGEIAWVPGLATDERFRVTARTTDRVRLAWHPAT
jgi:tRNA(Ile)-lysidine synthase